MLVYFGEVFLGGGIMGENNNIAKLIKQVIEREINSLREELKDEYSQILNDMNARDILYSGITASNIANKGNEIIKKHLEAVVKECNEFPFKIKERDWHEVQEKFKFEIEDLEVGYYDKLMKLKISFPQSPSPFQKSKQELEYLIKESITKGKIKGFESESNYKLASRKLAIIALIVSVISILISITIYFFRK
jgi:hypothetical protein